MIINGILGALVGVTAGCAVVTPMEAVPIGIVGSFLANITAPFLLYLKVIEIRFNQTVFFPE